MGDSRCRFKKVEVKVPEGWFLRTAKGRGQSARSQLCQVSWKVGAIDQCVWLASGLPPDRNFAQYPVAGWVFLNYKHRILYSGVGEKLSGTWY